MPDETFHVDPEDRMRRALLGQRPGDTPIPGVVPRSPESTSEQLRHDIDSGAAGDKAPGFDPAAAPMNTDAEAGGTAPSPGEIAQARKAEQRPASRHPNAAEPSLTPDGAAPSRGHIWMGVAAGAAGGAGLAWILFALARYA